MIMMNKRPQIGDDSIYINPESTWTDPGVKTLDQLKDWILVSLGAPRVTVELDDNQLKAEANANILGVPLKTKVFGDGVCVISENPRVETEYSNLRISGGYAFTPEKLYMLPPILKEFKIKHDINNRNVTVQVYNQDNVKIECSVKVLDENNILL